MAYDKLNVKSKVTKKVAKAPKAKPGVLKLKLNKPVKKIN